MFGTAAPALADDGPTLPRAGPAPRRERPTPSGASFEELITYASDAARDLAALQEQAREAATERNDMLVEISMLAALTERPSAVKGRLEREAVRLSASANVPAAAALSAPVREAADEMRAMRADLKQRYTTLEAQAEALAPFAVIAAPNGPWMMPAQGRITQSFGPVRLRLEPSRVYRGVFYPHFHDGIDIGAEMYSPVVAAAPGRVIFAGHLPDGAMIVLITHIGGLVSLYAHLDDQIAAPRVAAGDEVQAGQIIGAVGMSGMTTGPHLHFAVWRDGELIDPVSLIAP